MGWTNSDNRCSEHQSGLALHVLILGPIGLYRWRKIKQILSTSMELVESIEDGYRPEHHKRHQNYS